MCGWGSLDCCSSVCVCVCVCVSGGGVCSVWVRRARGSLDGWCMFVWCGWGVNYAGWDGSTCMWVGHF